MGAGLLVLLGATVARGLLASAFAQVNERLCSSRALTSGSSRCRTDDLLHAPRGSARRGIEARPRASRASLELLPFEDRLASIRVDGLWGMYQWLDRALKGRNEAGVWWRRHDEYDER